MLDLAHISNAAYMTLDEARDYISQEVTGAGRFNISLLPLDDSYGPITYTLDDQAGRTLVFAIRGTNAVGDLFQDLVSASTFVFVLFVCVRSITACILVIHPRHQILIW